MKPPSQPESLDARSCATTTNVEPDYPRPAYAWYVVAVLTLAYMFSFLDRQIIAFMVDPLQKDLKLSNAQIGLLHGTSFALFYTFFGLPVGRWADTRSRRGLIAVGFVLWSLMTAASGLAQKYWQLLLCRVGVGVGEATLSPAAYSLIADYFPPQRRATAIGVYSYGIYLGSGLSFVCLGLLTEFLAVMDSPVLPLVGAVRPWQAVFLIVGLPGLLCTLLLCTVREVPRRGVRKLASGVAGAEAMPLGEVFAFLSAHRFTFLSLFLGMAGLTFAGYANSLWVIKLFAVNHGWSKAQAGVIIGLIIALGGALGAMGGGRLADAWRLRGRADANLRVALLGAVAMTLAGLWYPWAGSSAWAAAGVALLVVGFSAPFGVVAAGIQQLVPASMRAQASALFLFVINLLGMGLGPLATGWLKDWLSLDDNSKSLPLALAIVLVSGSLAAVGLFALGFKSYRKTGETLAAANPAHA